MRRSLLAALLGSALMHAGPPETARENSRQASAAVAQSRRVMEAWLKRIDPVTGLLPRTGKDPNWVVRDSAADLYPFLVIASRSIDPGLYSTEMPRILRQEYLLSRRAGHLSDDLLPGGRGFVRPAAVMDEIIFGSSEYAKDGLLPLTELLGDTPWHQRLRGIADDIVRLSPYASPRGRLPAQTSEINGNMLQVLSRLYWKTRQPEYLESLLAIADYYLLDMLPATNYLPADLWDVQTKKALRPVFVLSDHGNEIVGGLSEACMLAERFHPEKARQYRQPFLRMIDRLLEKGRNEDGVWISRLDLETGKVVDARHAHCWGYLFNGVYTAHLISGESKYKEAVERAIAGVIAKPKYLFDETGAGRNWGSNAYSDSLEGALVLFNRLPGAPFAKAIDEATAKFLARVRDDGIVEDWYGDGNFIRTAMMYVFWKSEGAWLDPWGGRVHLGAAREGNRLHLHLGADSAWQGRLHFDYPRHREHWRMARNYPRLNEWPEWYAVEPQAVYRVEIEGRPPRDYVGWDLIAGLPLSLADGESLRLTVAPK
jgi:hypothetical protein